LQLPREIVVEESGEFRETCPPQVAENGDPEPSLSGRSVRKVQRLERELVLRPLYGYFPYGTEEAPDTLSPQKGTGDEIVQAQEKFWGACNQ